MNCGSGDGGAVRRVLRDVLELKRVLGAWRRARDRGRKQAAAGGSAGGGRANAAGGLVGFGPRCRRDAEGAARWEPYGRGDPTYKKRLCDWTQLLVRRESLIRSPKNRGEPLARISPSLCVRPGRLASRPIML